MNVQHSSRTDEWYTPPHVVELIRSVLGNIDLDPASSVKANKYLQADCIYTREDNGLELDWDTGTPRTIFVNPPGGKTKNKSNTALFWKKLMEVRNLKHAIFLAFSLEALQTTQGKGCRPILSYPLCVPSSRMKFFDSNWKCGPAPSHSNCLVYVPGTVDAKNVFADVFSSLGTVKL